MPIYRNGTHKHVKKYPRVSAGPLRNQLLHRIIAGAMLGRELDKSEQVHHKDSDRLNFHWTNLRVMGEKDHGWVSTKQAWFMQNRDGREKRDWDEFMAESNRKWSDSVTACRAAGKVWQGESDGNLQREYEQWRHRRERSRRKKERERKKLADLHLPPRDKDWMRVTMKGNAGMVPF